MLTGQGSDCQPTVSSTLLKVLGSIPSKATPTWYTGGHWYSISALGNIIESLSSDVSERRTSTGSGFFAHLSCHFEQKFGQIFSIRVKTLSHTNLVASRHIKREKISFPVDLRRSKTLLLKLSIVFPRALMLYQ